MTMYWAGWLGLITGIAGMILVMRNPWEGLVSGAITTILGWIGWSTSSLEYKYYNASVIGVPKEELPLHANAGLVAVILGLVVMTVSLFMVVWHIVRKSFKLPPIK